MHGNTATWRDRLRIAAARPFRPREVFLRTDGRMRRLVLSRRLQMSAAGVLAAAAAGLLWGAAELAVGFTRGGGDIERDRAAYAQLLDEVEHSYRQLAALAQGLATDDAAPASSNATGAFSSEALGARLAVFEDQLHGIVELNRKLTTDLLGQSERLADAERENRDLDESGRRLVAELGELRGAHAAANTDKVSLQRRLSGLESQLAVTQRTERALRAAAQLSTPAADDGGSIAKLVGYPIRRLFSGEGPEDALVLAVMKQESAFDPLALSPAGARGLMQLMPATAMRVADKLRLDYSKTKLLLNADFNIALGRAYLHELLNLFDRSYVLAIAAYNAGPQRVLQWMREFGDPRDSGVDVGRWVASIPYAETRNYVRKVMKSLDQYRDRLTDASAQRCFSLENASW